MRQSIRKNSLTFTLSGKCLRLSSLKFSVTHISLLPSPWHLHVTYVTENFNEERRRYQPDKVNFNLFYSNGLMTLTLKYSKTQFILWENPLLQKNPIAEPGIVTSCPGGNDVATNKPSNLVSSLIWLIVDRVLSRRWNKSQNSTIVQLDGGQNFSYRPALESVSCETKGLLRKHSYMFYIEWDEG